MRVDTTTSRVRQAINALLFVLLNLFSCTRKITSVLVKLLNLLVHFKHNLYYKTTPRQLAFGGGRGEMKTWVHYFNR